MTAAELRDLLVVGGGPAGSSLALRLARAGFRVALVDRKRFPRAKPCGEFLSPECLPILDELGVLPRLERLGAHRVRGMRLYGHGRHATGRFRPVGRSAVPFGAGLAVRRDLLDHELLRAAAACDGVELIEGTACVALQRDGGGAVRGALLAAPGGGAWPLHARWTIGADGIRSRVARELGALRPITWLDKLALTTRYRGVAALDTAEVHLFPRGYFAATAVDDGLFSLNLVLDRSAVRPHRGGWDAFFQQHLEAVPELAERLRGAHRVDRVRGAGPLGFRSRAQAFDGAALVGDACGYVDPITGEGIWFALRGAQLLAAELEDALRGGRTDRAALRRYERRRRREIAPHLWLARALQRGLRSTAVSRAVLTLLQRRPGLADLLVSVTGDYVALRELLRPATWRVALRGATAP